jgi:hypothetical protein
MLSNGVFMADMEIEEKNQRAWKPSEPKLFPTVRK